MLGRAISRIVQWLLYRWTEHSILPMTTGGGRLTLIMLHITQTRSIFVKLTENTFLGKFWISIKKGFIVLRSSWCQASLSAQGDPISLYFLVVKTCMATMVNVCCVPDKVTWYRWGLSSAIVTCSCRFLHPNYLFQLVF